MKCVLLFCSLGFFFIPCQLANIAVYMPLPFYSHQVTFKPLWLELAKRGHQITLIQSDIIVQNNENITHIHLNETYARLNKGRFFEKLAEGQSVIGLFLQMLETMSDVMQYHLTHPGVQKLLKGDKKIDLFFTEHAGSFGFSLGSKLNAPMIGLVSTDAPISSHLVMGNPTHPVMYPDKDLSLSPMLTFKNRLVSSFFWLVFKVSLVLVFNPLQEEVVHNCLGDVGPLVEIERNISLMFINANPLFNNERPLAPSTINIGGGLHILEPIPLPKDFQDYLDKGDKGVIYFSLGSSIKSEQISEATKIIILETFAQLPYNILWKFDEEPAGTPKNVKVVKWVPQQDLLRHKNIKLFITQGGLQSMEEAIFNYVPMVALPFYGDQLNNANKMAARGFGLTLDHTKMNIETFKSAILEVINDPRYRERTKQMADLIMDQPMTGLEKAVWWTEYVLRHGQTNIFRNPAINIPWYQYFLLDVIAFLVLMMVLVVYTIIKSVQILKWSIRKVCNIVKQRKKTKTS